ncbi:uncharacterized protein PGTG_14049 [Puccinia graminis f. sp. tritici CRL 75-36-700-3]|uniref:Uncharacterized protein n=1 Tax=Puccinia graminis f. sp. tritici (strain CRL 75-36-700-3 / race SCCL) TaxID=418459 RepID=E3KVZ6_PUCGT|nr:uncharacterized protein PGTG_14049 [Puccinia graminis f. sp. tritici CRL 75-36-700-3]EFP88471.2 hypothetical protein PGTG_14049 [Puccinia graminis f. sp. tritici CRL 75-36-700-3]
MQKSVLRFWFLVLASASATLTALFCGIKLISVKHKGVEFSIWLKHLLLFRATSQPTSPQLSPVLMIGINDKDIWRQRNTLIYAANQLTCPPLWSTGQTIYYFALNNNDAGKTTGLSLTSTRNEVKMLLLTIASLFCLVATYGSVVLEIPTSCRVCKSEVRQFNLQEQCGAHLMCTHEKALKATCHNMFTRIDFVCQNEGCPWTWQSPILEKCENKLHLGFCETCPDATFLEPYLEVRHQEIRPQGIRPQVIRPQAQGYIM